MKSVIETLFNELGCETGFPVYLVENTDAVLTSGAYPYVVLGFPALGVSFESLSSACDEGDFHLQITVADTTALNTLASVKKVSAVLGKLKTVPLVQDHVLVWVENVSSLADVTVDTSVKISDINRFPYYAVLGARVRVLKRGE